MPIHCTEEIRAISETEYHAIDEQVLGLAYQIQKEYGRFLSEELYQVGLKKMTPPGKLKSWDASWKRLCSITDEYIPGFRECLAPGASSDEIAELERHIGQELHPEHKFILQQANGCQGSTLSIEACSLLSCDEIAASFDYWVDLTVDDPTFDGPIGVEPAIRNDRCWQKEWVFFWGDDTLDGYVIDLCPTERGNTGQVFFVGHEFDHSKVHANSPMAFVDRLCDEIPVQCANGHIMGMLRLR